MNAITTIHTLEQGREDVRYRHSYPYTKVRCLQNLCLTRVCLVTSFLVHLTFSNFVLFKCYFYYYIYIAKRVLVKQTSTASQLLQKVSIGGFLIYGYIWRSDEEHKVSSMWWQNIFFWFPYNPPCFLENRNNMVCMRFLCFVKN